MKPAVWLIAGTGEGRILAEELAAMGTHVYVSVATAYGATLFDDNPDITVQSQRMNYEEMCSFIKKYRPELVVDSSHPYALVVTETVKKACEATNTEYMRMLRPPSKHPGAVSVKDFREAIELLSHTEGHIFLTTGSKNLVDFTVLPNFSERITARVLPLLSSLTNALDLGYKPANIICMQGPFSKELNIAMFKRYNTKFVVSKDSGKVGGFEEKLEAAEEVGAELILIDRNPEVGDNLTDILGKLRKRFENKEIENA